jgi:hypothetical protein
MATRSLISIIEHKDETSLSYKTIYCHFDGYPSHVGRILISEYDTADKVKSLIELGDLSCIEEGRVQAYHRDKGEAYNPPAMFSLSELHKQADTIGAEYSYMFNGQDWECWRVHDYADIDLYTA